MSLKIRNVFLKEKTNPVIESFVLIVLILILYFGNLVPLAQSKDLLEVLALNNQGTVGKVEAYTKPLSGYGMGFPESLEHISQIVVNLGANQQVSTELKQGLFEKVDQAFVKHITKVPDDTRYRLFYGLFLSRFGWYGKATEQLDIASKLSPKKQQIYFELMSNLIADNKIDKALLVAKTAYELEPNYEEARFIYGLTLLAAGQTTLSQQIFADTPIEKIILDDRYVSVLAMLKKYTELIEVVKKRIQLEPSNMQHRITLAAAYLQAEQRENAIKTIEEMIQLDPSFKEKGDYYIAEIRAGRNP